MKVHDTALLKIIRLRTSLSKLRSSTQYESVKIALTALIAEVDKLPSIASDLFEGQPVRFAVEGPRSFPFADLQPGGHFDVDHDRVASLRACASGFGRRHGMTLTVREKPNGGARCIRIDGIEGTPDGLREVLAERQMTAPPKGESRPVVTSAARAGVDPLDLPQRLDERTAFHAPQDRAIEDPETADDVRAAMAIPEDKRTDWQQFVVDEYQHLIEFEHVKPTYEVVHAALLVDGVRRTPRQAWLVANHLDVVEAGPGEPSTF